MGTPMGYFDDDARDYPELNKCPDCETFFADLNCPLCGKECPEAFRAGNRKPVKVKKQRRRGSERVQFVPWYFSTWFIILMLVVQPIIGLVLMWAGGWRKPAKIVVTVLLVLAYFSSLITGGLALILSALMGKNDAPPVSTDLSQAEYIQICEDISAEELYRNVTAHLGEEVALTVQIKGKWDGREYYEEQYTTYLQCVAVENGREWEFLIRDCRGEGAFNLAVGDVITVYGEVGGNMSIHNYTAGDLSAPGVNMLFAVLETQS